MGLIFRNKAHMGFILLFCSSSRQKRNLIPRWVWNPKANVKPNQIVRLKNFARGSLFFQERLHKFPTTGRATWMRHTGSGIPTFWTCFHPVDMDMQTLLHKFERRHCYWQKKRNQKRQYQNTTNIAWIIHADCACYHCVLKKLSSEFHAPMHDFNQPIYCTIFGREKNQGQIANTNSHNFNCSRRFYMWSVR